MLDIRDLQVGVEGEPILRGISLAVKAGEMHAVVGAAGSGKSTLANVLAGREGYAVTGGMRWLGRDLAALAPEERARQGIFVTFEHPVEIPGVSNLYLLKAALNAARRARGETELDSMAFLDVVKARMAALGMNEALLYRAVNEGVSVGEKRRNEILQMAVLEPRLAILDEPDPGLDGETLKAVAEGVNALRSPKRAMILMTCHPRLLGFVAPDVVHVLVQGRIVRSGGRELALELERRDLGRIEPEGGHERAA